MASMEMIGFTSDKQRIPEEVRDVVQRDDGKFIVAATREVNAVLIDHVPTTPFAERLVVPRGSQVEGLISLSDNLSFWDLGYPAMIVTDTAFLRNPHYHRKTDTADRLDYNFLEDTVDLVQGWVESMIRGRK